MIGAVPRKRVYAHGDHLTVCSAGISRDKQGEQVLVTCTDTGVTISGFASSDMAMKFELGRSMPVLVSDNAARAKELVAILKEHAMKIADDSILGKLKEAAKTHKNNLLDEYFGLT